MVLKGPLARKNYLVLIFRLTCSSCLGFKLILTRNAVLFLTVHLACMIHMIFKEFMAHKKILVLIPTLVRKNCLILIFRLTRMRNLALKGPLTRMEGLFFKPFGAHIFSRGFNSAVDSYCWVDFYLHIDSHRVFFF